MLYNNSALIVIHVAQIRLYKNGTSQPNLDVIRKITIVLHISPDKFIFDDNEWGDDDFAAVSRLTPE